MSAKSKKTPPAHSGRSHRNRKKSSPRFIIALLILAIILMGVYAGAWYFERGRIRNDSLKYQSMYAPGEETVSSPTPAATASPVPAITASPTPEATGSETEEPTEDPGVTETPTEEPIPTAEPVETLDPGAGPEPLATANEGTLVFALPTPPPVQSSFDELLSLNSDTVGFLTVDDVIALPVVQRANDNDYYLDHNFEQEPANEGALFLDGSNLLVPEDDCLIIYGHNMKNDTMFGRLESFGYASFLKKHPIVRFDTLYENRSYVPFAVFSASMDPDSSHYFDVRQFIFDETSFELFTLKMQTRSHLDIPVNVRFGDDILLLVTCEYANDSGRFIVALRRLRPGESEDSVRAKMQNVHGEG